MKQSKEYGVILYFIIFYSCRLAIIKIYKDVKVQSGDGDYLERENGKGKHTHLKNSSFLRGRRNTICQASQLTNHLFNMPFSHIPCNPPLCVFCKQEYT